MLSLIICAGLLFCSSLTVMCQDALITVGSTNGNVGDTVSLDITIQNNPGMAGGSLNIFYDPSLVQPKEAAKGGLLSEATPVLNINSTVNQHKAISLAWINLTDIKGDGIIFTISFNLLKRGTANLELGNLSLKNDNLKNINVAMTNGSITVKDKNSGSSGGGAVAHQEDTPPVNQLVEVQHEKASEKQVLLNQPVITVNPAEIPKNQTDKQASVTNTSGLLDVQNHWASTSINKLATRKIMNGYPDGTFLPDNKISRAEFACVIVTTMNLPIQQDSPLKFADNDSIGNWAKPDIAAAVQAGILNGYEDNTFRASNSISRMEMAIMVANAMKKTPSQNPQLNFADSSSVPPWAAGFIKIAVDNGIIKGKGNNLFAPNDNATRAEAATMMVNMLNALGI